MSCPRPEPANPGPAILAETGEAIERMLAATTPDEVIEAAAPVIRSILPDAACIVIETRDGASSQPFVISARTRQANPDELYVQVSYPLEVSHPDWKTARMVAEIPQAVVNNEQDPQGLVAVLSILARNITRTARSQNPEESGIDQLLNLLDASLWEIGTFRELRAAFATWMGEATGADYVLVYTESQNAGSRDKFVTGFSSWPDKSSVPSGLLLLATRDLHGDDIGPDVLYLLDESPDELHLVQVAAGFPSSVSGWSNREAEIGRAGIEHLHRHLTRLSKAAADEAMALVAGDMQQLTRAASAAAGIDELCRLTHHAIRTHIPLASISIRLNTPERQEQVVYETPRPATTDDLHSFEEPIVSDNAVVGVIRVDTTSHQGVEPGYREMLRAINQSVAGAFDRNLLLEQIERRTRYETAMRNVAERISSTIDPDELTRVATDVIFETIQCDYIAVSIIDRNTNRVQARSFRAADRNIQPPPMGFVMTPESITWAAIQGNQQIVVHDAAESDYSTFGVSPWSELGTAVATPVSVNSQLAGIMMAGRAAPHSFTSNELTLQQQIAAMLSTALENAFSYETRLRHARDLDEIQRLGSRIASQLDLPKSLDSIVESATKLVGADGGAVAVREQDELVIVATTGIARDRISERLPFSGALLEQLVANGVPMPIDNLQAAAAEFGPELHLLGFARAMLAVPLVDADGNSAGVIGVFSSAARRWTDRDMSLLQTLAATSAIALQNARHFESTRDLLRASVESLAAAVEAKDPETRNHSRQVARYSRIIAEELGLTQDVVSEIELAGLLHDVGKIGIPDSVLEKPGPLDAAEWAAVHLHPAIGEQILSGNPTLDQILPMVRHHHERWDGHGYPDQLSGQDIPVGATVIAVAEAVDAMTTNRPYGPARTWQEAVQEVLDASGTQFAPPVVDAFYRASMRGLFREDELRVAASATSTTVDWMTHRTPALDVRALRIFEAVANEIREGADMTTFIQNIVLALHGIVGVHYLAIFVRANEDVPLRLIASRPETPSWESLEALVNDGKGVVGWVARYGVIQNIPDVSRDDRYVPGGYAEKIQSELCVPLLAEGQVIGVMNLESTESNAFSAADEQLMVSAADHIANAVHVIQLHERLKRLSTTDALTGLYNHRTFFEKLVSLTSTAQEEGTELTVAIVDVDDLKAINDSYGHLAGDAALRGVAGILLDHRRPQDVICRYGGDEFAIILPNTSQAEAWTILESLAIELLDRSFTVEGMSLPLPAASWGTATAPTDGSRAMELLATADQRMYRHKESTRV